MKIKRRIKLNTIYNEDCIFTMSKIQNNFIDLIVTSPPYDNLRDYYKYNFKFKIIARELYRIIKIGGIIVWIVNDQTINGSESLTSFKQALYFKKIKFNIHDTMIYAKNICPFPEYNRYYQSFEYMFVLSKGKPKTVNLINDKINSSYKQKIIHGTERQKNGTLKKRILKDINKKIKKYGVRQNIWFYSPGYLKSTKYKDAYKHPAIFPEKLAIDHIISWSNKYDIIYDPFLGSGTTCVAAKLTGRKYIGSEISKEYFKMAKERIKKTQLPIEEQKWFKNEKQW